MELKQLRYFVRIVDLGSFSKAASDVHIVQSALSDQVAALEDELKVPLLHRTARGVSPTDAGALLYRRAQEILRQAEDARVSVQQQADEPAGPVSFGVPLSLVQALGLSLISSVKEQYPHVRLVVHEGVSGALLEWIKNGRLSLGLAFDDGNLDGLQVTRVMEERLFLVVSPRNKLARRKSITPSELQDVPLLMPSPSEGVRPQVERAMVRHGLSLRCVQAEVNSFAMMKFGAAQDVAPTILSWPGIAEEVNAGSLAAVEIVRPSISRICAMCILQTAAHSRSANAVAHVALEILRARISQASWRGVRYIGP